MTEKSEEVNTNENFNSLKGKTFEIVIIHEKLTPEQVKMCIDAGILSPEWVCNLRPMDNK